MHTLFIQRLQFIFDLAVMGKTTGHKPLREFVLSSPAPVETASKMSHNLWKLAEKEKERAKDLIAAGNYCEEMAVELTALAAAVKGPAMLLKVAI
jgi:hypothetical protein